MDRYSIASKLKELRKDKKLSVKDVCEKLNVFDIDVKEKTIYGWESGHRQPDADTFILLCEIYEVKDILNEFKGVKNKSYAISEIDYKFIKKYHSLNESDKSTVDFIFNKPEYNQSTKKLHNKSMNIPTDMEISEELGSFSETIVEDLIKNNDKIK